MLHPFSARAQGGQAHLRILSTTDLHCHVQPYDYYADKPTDTVGLARTASIIEAIRAEATNTLLVDNGDYLQGNPMGDYIAYERGMQPGDVHPVIAGMNTLAYEAGTLGNHEFNYGVEFLDLVNAGAAFPIVCANFARTLGAGPRDDALHLEPYVILSRTITDGAGQPQAIKVGLIGFVPPQIMLWDRGHLEGRFQTRDIVEAARAWVPQMREEGADIVVALSHSGIETGPEAAMMENASLQLAGIDGIDAVVTGHQHRVWPSEDFAGDGIDLAAGTLMGKPAAMAGFWGSHMGLIDLMLERDGAGWRVAGSEFERAPDLRAQRGPQHHRPRRRLRPGDRGDRRRPCRDPRLRARRGRPVDGAAPVLLRHRRRRPLGADRQPGADLVRDRPPQGHRMGGPAGPLRRRPVQVRRPRRPRLLHRRPRRPDRDQERRRRLPLPEHAAGGGDHRGRGQGMARALGRRLPAGRARRRRPAADRPRLSRLQLRRHSMASPTRST